MTPRVAPPPGALVLAEMRIAHNRDGRTVEEAAERPALA
jgi:hypothetical protein